uniref:Plasmid mobilization relaxosome protein MobC n=2 Tax=Desmonostoc muscorum TaxID=1179 RepID=A0A8J6ZZ54_DESMC
MASENNLTISELFRAKTLKNRLPRRVTKVAGQTYWELGKIGNNLNQIAKAINTSALMGEPVVVDRALLSQVRDLVKQVRREIAEIDLITDLQDEA